MHRSPVYLMQRDRSPKDKTDTRSNDAGADPAATENSNLHEERGREKGGPKGPEPTRYGDWEKNGRCIDF